MNQLNLPGEVATVQALAMELATRFETDDDAASGTLANFLVMVAQGYQMDLTLADVFTSLDKLIQQATEAKDMLRARAISGSVEDEHVPIEPELRVLDSRELVRIAFHLAICEECIQERYEVGVL